jgi:hypothetical protein
MSEPILSVRFPYPYEEFADHIRAMRMVRRWEYTERFGHLGTDQNSQANSARIVEYFSDTYANQQEALQKAELFLLISDYLARHAALFARKGLVDAEGEGLISVEPALLRAVHHLFTSGSSVSADPKKMLLLAKAFKELEG